MRLCPNCGSEAGDWMFCKHCGKNLKEYFEEQEHQEEVFYAQPMSESQDNGNVCPNCGSDTGGWAFCPSCGTKVSRGESSARQESSDDAEQNTWYQNTDSGGSQDYDDGFIQEPRSFADSSANNQQYGVNPSGPAYQNNFTPPIPPTGGNPNPNFKKKRSMLPVILIIIVTAVVIAAIVLVSLLMFGDGFDFSGDSSSRDHKHSSSSSGETVTEVPTTDPSGSNSGVGGDEYVVMPNCYNQSAASIKTKLVGLGLNVVENSGFSETVAKNNVCAQDVQAGTKIKKGYTVTITVSKGSDKCPYEYEQKLTVTASSGSSSAKAVLYEWKEGMWTKIASYTAKVASSGIGTAKEGSSVSPKGIHKLGVVLTNYSVSTSLSVYRATKDTCVVDDTSSPYYNQIMEKSSIPSGTHYDNIGETLCNGTTYATIYIEHNGSGLSSSGVVKGNGSAIGLRGQSGSLSATYGDVDISESDMRDLLSKLNASKNPVIELKTN